MNALAFLLAAVVSLAPQIRDAPSQSWVGFRLPHATNHDSDCDCTRPVYLYFHIVDHQIDRMKATCRTPLGKIIDDVSESVVDETLIDLARRGEMRSVRKNALFWLSVEAGEKAKGTLREAVDDPDTSIKTAAVFGISNLPDNEGVPILIDLAEHHPSREVRKRAIFWLGQKNDPRALDALVDIIRQ